MNRIKIILCLVGCLITLPSIVMAETFPSFPMSFYGEAKLDNNNLLAGTKIQAYSNNILVGEVVMQEDGIYGYNNPIKSKLTVGEYSDNELFFKYVLSNTSEALTGNNLVKYNHGFEAGNTLKFNLFFTENDTSEPDPFSFPPPPPPPPPSSGSGGGGSYTPPSNQIANNVPLKISFSQKGTLNQNLNNKNKVKVEIPKGSIKSTTTFTASEGSLEEGDVPKDKVGAFLFNGLAFNVNAVDSSKKAVREFSEDLTITLTVPDLPDDTTSLELYYYDEESKKWIIVTGVVFGNNTITFKVNHLTQFAVFETNATKAGSASGTPEVKGITTTEIFDGDIIQCQSSDNPFAVYIVKIVGDTKYIRHIVSLGIFNYYGHLKWENLKQVDSLDSYSLSGWVRYNTGANGTAGPTDKVYEINGDQTKHWINMTAEDFLSHGGSEPAIYSVNQGELDLYATGADVMSL